MDAQTYAMPVFKTDANGVTYLQVPAQETEMPAQQTVSGNGHQPSELETTYKLTDLGNAERFVAMHKENVRYCWTWQKWLIWKKQRWAVDEIGEIVQLAKEVVRGIYAEASLTLDKQERKAIADHARRSESDGRIAAMLSLARSEPQVAITSGDLNKDTMLLNCLNGTIDLRDGTLREHRRGDLITRLAPVNYDPDAKSEILDRFLNDCTGGDRELLEFLPVAFGYSTTGSTREEKFFLVHGPTNSGKSTAVEMTRAALDDYSMQADFETFLARNMVGGVRNDIARLEGARFVCSIEVDEGKRLAEGLVKTLTGGDTIAARFLYQEAFEFKPQFKLWLAVNHAPTIRDDDDAIWRRIVRVPFEHTVPEDKRDPKVKEFLTDPSRGGPAVLAWLVKGCLEWQKNGLKIPGAIRNATNNLRTDMNPLKDFFEDDCLFGDLMQVGVSELRQRYDDRCEKNGDKFTISSRRFNEHITAKGCIQEKTTGGKRIWRGVGLKA